MDAYASELFKDPSVKGVACVDNNGATYFTKGTLNSNSAAIISQLSSLASSLETSTDPIVTVQSTSSKLIIKHVGPLSVAVHKTD
jgi:hypothetical protein